MVRRADVTPPPHKHTWDWAYGTWAEDGTTGVECTFQWDVPDSRKKAKVTTMGCGLFVPLEEVLDTFQKARDGHLLTDDETEAISGGASIMSRLAGSYEVYGGIELKKALLALEPIVGEV